MRLGIDVSTYFEELEHGAKYFDGDAEVSPLEMFRQNGVDIMRIRVWVDPYGENGEPYLAGTCDLDNFKKLAQLSADKGYKIMLDFHFSDFWCDPGKQFVPKAWRNLNYGQLVEKIRQYTAQSLHEVREAGIDLEYIQVGNEITNGILWPFGQLTGGDNEERSNYDGLCGLLKSAVTSCREVYPKAKLMLHLERSYDQAVYNEFFSNMDKFGVDYDVIGFSYYPCWHGTFEQLFANVDNCKKFGKEEIIVEAAYPFTGDDYVQNIGYGDGHLSIAGNGLLPPEFSEQYPLTPEGQIKYTKTLLQGAEQHGVAAVCWWEPLWLPGEGICWASRAAQRYLKDNSKDTRNEWSNQCLFDYNGKKLPAFDLFKLPIKR